MRRLLIPVLALIVAIFGVTYLVQDNSQGLKGQVVSGSVSVTSLTLVNASDESDIKTLSNGDALYLDELPTQLNVRANTSSSVNSLRFGYDTSTNYRIENVAPYALGGDSSGNYNNFVFTLGSHTITATPYPLSSTGGTAGTSSVVNFTVAATRPDTPLATGFSGSITRLDFYDAESDSVVQALSTTELNVIDLSDLDNGSYNVSAVTSSDVLSVKFFFQGELQRVEDSIPYSIFGDVFGNYNEVTPEEDVTYIIKAIPYSLASAGGDAGSEVKVSIRFERDLVRPITPITITPTPPIPTTVSVIRLEVVDTNGNVVATLNEGDVLDPSVLPPFSVQAITTEDVGSVVFGVDGVNPFRTENIPPYVMTGDTGGDAVAWNPSIGSHTITARPYTGDSASGTVGATFTRTFSVLNDGGGTEPTSEKFEISDRVATTTLLNVRATPDASTALGSQALGLQGTVIGGPQYAGGYFWWNIDYDSAPDGWSVENWLIDAPVSGPDTIAPSVPTAFNATASGTAILLNWNPSTDSVGVVAYDVQRRVSGSTTFTTIASPVSNSYTDTSVVATQVYDYRVIARDAAGNASVPTAMQTVTSGSSSPFTSFEIGDEVQVTATSLNVRASANGSILGTQPLGAIGQLVSGPVFMGSFEWWNVDFTRGTTITGLDGWIAVDYTAPVSSYQVSENIDESGPTWSSSTPLSAMAMGTTAAPMIHLDWTDAVDSSGISSYRVYAGDGTPLDYGIIASETHMHVSPGSTYTYYIVAFDSFLNYSVNTNTVSVTTAPYTSPTTGGNWTSPSTWPTGTVPGAGADVVISSGMDVVVNTSVANVGEVTVYGALTFADTDLTFQAENIFVLGDGIMEVGTAGDPIENDITIELTANPAKGFDGVQHNKVLSIGGEGTSGNARLDMHGIRSQSIQWTQLVPLSGEPGYSDGGYASGADKLKFKDNVATGAQPWRVGDKIVVAPTDFPDGVGVEATENIESEVVSITAVHSDGSVSISPALGYYHHATVETVSGGGETVSVDMRAEVGLLTRNIKVIGDVDDVNDPSSVIDGSSITRLPSDNNAFGVHIMIMSGTSHAQVEGVEIQNGGQLGQPGRYPFHWHFAGDMTGSYFSRNSVVDSNQRCVVVHGTNNATVEWNVTHNNWNHCFSIEDGGEIGNIIRNNLAVKVKQMHPYGPGGIDGSAGISGRNWMSFPCKGGGCTVSNGSGIAGVSFQDERHVAAFWISNPNNKVEGNHAAGGAGSIGFMYDVGEKPYANYENPSAGSNDKYDPLDSPYTMDASDGAIFKNNLAHSFADWGSAASGTTNFTDRSDYITSGMGFFSDDIDVGDDDNDGDLIFEDFTTYANEVMGVWIESEATVVRNFIVAESGSGYNIYRSTVEDSYYIRDLGVPGLDMNRDYGAVNLASGTDQRHSEKEPRVDGLKVFNNNGSPSIFVQGRKKNEGGGSPEAQRVGVMAFLNNIEFFSSSAKKFEYQQDSVDAAIADVDGSVSGSPNFLVSKNYHSCTVDSTLNARLCPLTDWSALNIYADHIVGDPIVSSGGNITLKEPDGTNRIMFKTDTYESDWMNGWQEEKSEIIGANQTYEVTFNSRISNEPFNIRLKGYNTERGHILKIKNMTSAPDFVRVNGSTILASSSASSLGYSADGYHYDAAADILTIAVRLNSGSNYDKVIRITP